MRKRGAWLLLALAAPAVLSGLAFGGAAAGPAATASGPADSLVTGTFRLSRPPAVAGQGPVPGLRVEVREGRLLGVALQCPPSVASSLANSLQTDGGFRLDVVWTDWQAPGKVNNADNECRFTAADFRCVRADLREDARGQELTLTLRGPEGLTVELTHALRFDELWPRRRLRVSDPRGRGHYLQALYTLDAVVAPPAGIRKAGGFGQPVVLGLVGDNPATAGAFFGLEWPAADNGAEPVAGGVRVRCGQEIGEVITAEGIAGEPAVMAVTPDLRVKHWFMEYLDSVRAAPLRPYTLYNSWYDLRSAEYPRVTPDHVMNEENVLRIARLLRENMVERHDITLDAFVLDDGWDVYESDWVLRPAQFPHGLAPIVDELKLCGTRLGMWYGPIGGYSFRKKRVAWMREHGYETVGDQMWVGGPKYSALLQRRTTDMARAGVRYFKWDGFQFLATGPDLGTPPGICARRAVLKRVQAMVDSVRAMDPDMFLNITSGTWLSPWWLRFADQIWMGGEDYGAADVPSPTTRDASITYRDLVLHEDFRQNDFWFPLANLMTHGVLKGTIDVQDIGKGEPLSKFADEVVFYLARGVTMHELYISPDVLSEGEWGVLADALRWARDRFPVLKSTEMIGGDPNRLEPYGYAHWNRQRGIIAVRNPDVAPRALTVALGPAEGLLMGAMDVVLERVYPTRWISPRTYPAGTPVELPALLGYEAAVYEVYPLSQAGGPLLADVVFAEAAPAGEDGGTRAGGAHAAPAVANGASRDLLVLETGPDARVLGADAQTALTCDGHALDPAVLPRLRPAGEARFAAGEVSVARGGRALRARIMIGPSARAATAGLLLQPLVEGDALPEPVVTMTVDGRPAMPGKVAVAGKWAWLTVPLAPGEHQLEAAFGGGSGGAKGRSADLWAGRAALWVTGAEAVEPAVVKLAAGGPAPAPRPLPSTGLGPTELPRSVHVGDVRLDESRPGGAGRGESGH